MAKVAINGLGRIGRATLKIVIEDPNMELVGVNDIASPENTAYLLQYDSVYGRYPKKVSAEEGKLIVGDTEIPLFSERNPADLPWGELGVDVVFESTGVFLTQEKAGLHIEAGAKWVIISAPAKDDTPTVVHGVNDIDGNTKIFSCASCTTNSVAPVVEIIGRRLGIQKAIMTTVHGYTSTQALVDLPAKSFVRGRAAAVNIIPTTTGAAVATTKTLPQYKGKFDGIAMRVPVPAGSVSDIVILTEKDTTVEEINAILTEEAASDKYNGVFGVTEIPMVSTDILGMSYASLADLAMTKVVDGNLIKILAWYDNEWSYTSNMVRQAQELAETMIDG